MITKTWLLARIDQLAGDLRGETFTSEEIATLAVAVGLEWSAMCLRLSKSMSGEAQEAIAIQLDRLHAELVGEDT